MGKRKKQMMKQAAAPRLQPVKMSMRSHLLTESELVRIRRCKFGESGGMVVNKRRWEVGRLGECWNMTKWERSRSDTRQVHR